MNFILKSNCLILNINLFIVFMKMTDRNEIGLQTYYQAKIEEYLQKIRDKRVKLARMEAQRNETNEAGSLI